MIEILKVSIHEKDGVKMVGIKYAKDGICKPFILMRYKELSDGLGDTELKQAVLTYLN
ncbi:MAG: hypothetical protein HQ507_12290 [Candidatus Marinimicrobia bacterium]|nr:hypothetical protein [Candidatus Neomarinimicrobiota bacterium]